MLRVLSFNYIFEQLNPSCFPKTNLMLRSREFFSTKRICKQAGLRF